MAPTARRSTEIHGVVYTCGGSGDDDDDDDQGGDDDDQGLTAVRRLTTLKDVIGIIYLHQLVGAACPPSLFFGFAIVNVTFVLGCTAHGVLRAACLGFFMACEELHGTCRLVVMYKVNNGDEQKQCLTAHRLWACGVVLVSFVVMETLLGLFNPTGQYSACRSRNQLVTTSLH